MKITVNVDCTPDEARNFFGLPDVKPLQAEMMKIMRDKTLENLKMMEPEGIMKMMTQGMNQSMGQMNDWFNAVMTGAASGMKKSTKR